MSSSVTRIFSGSRPLFQAAKAAGAKAAMRTPPPAAASTKPPKNAGIMKPVPVSPAMRKFLGGVPEISRAEAVKKVWDHIKLHNLQNPANRREINCDDKLKSIFAGKDKVGMLEISRLLAPHFSKSN